MKPTFDADGAHPLESHAPAEEGASFSTSENRYRAMIENSSDLVALVGRDGTILYASRSVERLLGYPATAYVGRKLFSFVHPDDLRRAETCFEECLRVPAVPTAAEYRHRHRDGTWRYLEGVTVNRLDDPAVGAMVANCWDITDRKLAEQALRESEEQFRAVFDSAILGIARLDGHGRIVDCNRGLLQMSGYAAEELRGCSFIEFLPPEERQAGAVDFRDLIEGRRNDYQVERQYCRKDGSIAWVNLTLSIVRTADGLPHFCIAMLENISERKQAEEALRQSHKRLTRWVTELEQRTREISFLNEMGELLQACRSPDEAYGVIGRMVRQLFPLEHGALAVLGDESRVVEAVATWGVPVGEHLFAPDECWALRRGRVHLVEDIQLGLVCKHLHRPLSGPYVCIPMMAQGESIGLLTLTLHEPGGTAAAKQQLAQTVAEHAALSLANLKLQQSLRLQSIRDPLTGLFNRRYMEESLGRETRRATRGRHPVGIIMLDLDHFKQINDAYGHEAGDLLLREVGSVLLRSVRGEDIACRYGGEEFTLILPEAALADAAQRAEQIRLAIKNLNVLYRRQALQPITASLGVAVYPDHGGAGDAVLAAADSALYEAKARGRDRVAVAGRSE